MNHGKGKTPSLGRSNAKLKSTNEVIGPFYISYPDVFPTVFLEVQALGCDDANRIYVVGLRADSHDPYLVRISAEGTLEGGAADVDLDFGENGFVPISVGGADDLLLFGSFQIIETASAHLTISFEVLDRRSSIYQVALCRFLIDGRVDRTFGVEGIALFPQLPEPSSAQVAVSVAPGLTGSGDLDQTKQVSSMSRIPRARGNEALHETGGAAAGQTSGNTLANGQMLLVVHKRTFLADKFSYLIKVNPDGTLDSSYAGGVGYIRLAYTGSSRDSLYTVSIDSTERAVVVSETEEWTHCIAARFTENGELDPSFGGGGFIQISSPTGAVYRPAVKIDGNDKTVISVCYLQSGTPSKVYLYRLENDGGPDPVFNNGNPIELQLTTFDLDYLVRFIDIDEQQRVVLRGTYYDARQNRQAIIVSRCAAQGLDPTFGESGSFSVTGYGRPGYLAMQSGPAVVTSDNINLWRLVG